MHMKSSNCGVCHYACHLPICTVLFELYPETKITSGVYCIVVALLLFCFMGFLISVDLNVRCIVS